MVRLVVVGLLLIASLSPGALLGPVGKSAAAAGPGVGPTVAQTDLQADSVFLRVQVTPNGTGDWRVQYRIRLSDENDSTAFESVREDIEASPAAFTDGFATDMNRTVANAERATGREMALRNVSVSARRVQLPREYGVITYSFVWTGFAEVDGDELRAGDALSGLFLDQGTSLLIGWPAGYRATSIAPAPAEEREGAAVWDGPTDFGPGEPRVVATSAPPPETPTTTPSPTATPPPITTETATASADETAGRTPAATTAATVEGTGGRQLPIGGLAVAAVILLSILGIGSRVYDPGDRTSGPTEPDADLRTPEERVLSMIEDHGGRMKQGQVTEALGWTDARTSQVVGGLRESESVEVFRLGRENVLSLPDDSDT